MEADELSKFAQPVKLLAATIRALSLGISVYFYHREQGSTSYLNGSFREWLSPIRFQPKRLEIDISLMRRQSRVNDLQLWPIMPSPRVSSMLALILITLVP